MAGSWLVIAGQCSLYLFFLFVGASLVVIRHRRVTRLTSEAAPAAEVSWVGRWFMEYVGNIDEGDVATAGAGVERRRNHPARVLMEHILDDLANRQVPQTEARQVAEELRESVRAVEPERAS